MTRTAIEFADVHKTYRRGGTNYATLRDDVARAAKRILRRGERQMRGTTALVGASFSVNEGSAFALLGPNGAGKSTALKLAARISFPTSGEIRIRGRVGALMEVGSGIHPELSGRENIWLYGTILGIPRSEIAHRFDQIVDFAELAGSIDTQVKYYSSGMQLRLGFSIASTLEPDVFLVDEALAVGDAAFRRRCVERMTTMVNEGRTLVFVSHSLPLVQDLCDSAALIEDGRIIAEGSARSVISTYTQRLRTGASQSHSSTDRATVLSVAVTAGTDVEAEVLSTYDDLDFSIELDVPDPIDDAVPSIGISDGRPGNLIALSMVPGDESIRLERGRQVLRCRALRVPLLPGTYQAWFIITARDRAVEYFPPRVVATFDILNGPPSSSAGDFFGRLASVGPVYVPFEFSVDREG